MAAAAEAGDPVVLDKPQPMRLTLADGTTLGGQVARWDDDGFDGPIGRHRWEELKPLEAFRVRKKLIEALPSGDRKARMLDLLTYVASFRDKPDDKDSLVERAEKECKSLGATAEEITQAQGKAAELKQVRAERERAAARAKLSTASPEAGPFPQGAWPPFTQADQERQLLALRQRVTERLAKAGKELTGVEGDFCIVWSDLGTADAAKQAVEIDLFVRSVLKQLGVAEDQANLSLRTGKVAFILAESADRYRLLEASAFGHQAAKDEVGMVHYEGPDAIAVILKQGDPIATQIETLRATARGVLHRLASPVRLPPWAHEGLVDWLVLSWAHTASIDKELRPPGLAFIRNGGSLEKVLGLTYEEGTWPGPDLSARAAGYLVVGLMMEQAPQRFQKFLAAVKAGKPWKQALEEDFGSKPAALLDSVRRHYRFND